MATWLPKLRGNRIARTRGSDAPQRLQAARTNRRGCRRPRRRTPSRSRRAPHDRRSRPRGSARRLSCSLNTGTTIVMSGLRHRSAGSQRRRPRRSRAAGRRSESDVKIGQEDGARGDRARSRAATAAASIRDRAARGESAGCPAGTRRRRRPASRSMSSRLRPSSRASGGSRTTDTRGPAYVGVRRHLHASRSAPNACVVAPAICAPARQQPVELASAARCRSRPAGPSSGSCSRARDTPRTRGPSPGAATWSDTLAPCERSCRARSASAGVVGRQHAAFAERDRLARVKAEAGDVAGRADRAALIGRADRAGRVLDDRQCPRSASGASRSRSAASPT